MRQIELTNEEHLYLQSIFDYFHTHARWPTYRHLETVFAEMDLDVDSKELVQNLPLEFINPINLDFSPFGTATLTVHAVYYLQKNAPELGAFLQVLKLCVNTYIHSVGDARQMSSGTVLQMYPTWFKPAIYKVGLLLEGEMDLWTTFNLDDERWSCKLSRNVRRFRDIETIEEYLEKRAPPTKKASTYASSSSDRKGVDITAQYDQLNPDIHKKCWRSYSDEDYDTAILNATKALEVAVRKKSKLADNIVGADLITQALNPNKPILEYSATKAEQEGMMSLLRGIIMVYKNPQSHRFVGVQNKSECLGILLLCSNLLYTIENIEQR